MLRIGLGVGIGVGIVFVGVGVGILIGVGVGVKILVGTGVLVEVGVIKSFGVGVGVAIGIVGVVAGLEARGRRLTGPKAKKTETGRAKSINRETSKVIFCFLVIPGQTPNLILVNNFGSSTSFNVK